MDKVLILGGTNFIGRNLVEALLAIDSYDLTLFNRGVTNPELFPNIKKIIGDRNTSDLELAMQENWDYIIDLSCYFPDALSHIDKINSTPKRYIFISTCSVYDNEENKSVLRNESSPILSCSETQRIDTSVNTYGHRKAECERVVQKSGLTHTILRPALVYGRYDTSDRFYYWLYHIQKENSLLIPNGGVNLFSITYVNDLVQSILSSLNPEHESGTYTITTRPTMSLSKLVDTASIVLGKKSSLHHTNSAFLKKHNIAEWTDLPLWLDCDYYTYDNAKAIDELGLKPTNFLVSVRETSKYFDDLDWPNPTYGITKKIKNDLIDKVEVI